MFRRGEDSLFRRCVGAVKVPAILAAYHNSVCRGYFLGQLPSQKILRTWYFWPKMFKDTHDYMKRCDVCQRYARNNLRMDLPVHVSLPLIPFEKWGINYIEEVHPKSSKGMAYIVVVTEYLTKWAEAKAMQTDTAANAAVFLYENIISNSDALRYWSAIEILTF